MLQEEDFQEGGKGVAIIYISFFQIPCSQGCPRQKNLKRVLSFKLKIEIFYTPLIYVMHHFRGGKKSYFANVDGKICRATIASPFVIFFLFHLFCSGIRHRCVFLRGEFLTIASDQHPNFEPYYIVEPKTKLRHKQRHATCHECTSLFYQFGGIEFAKIVCLKSFDRTRHVPIKK